MKFFYWAMLFWCVSAKMLKENHTDYCEIFRYNRKYNDLQGNSNQHYFARNEEYNALLSDYNTIIRKYRTLHDKYTAVKYEYKTLLKQYVRLNEE